MAKSKKKAPLVRGPVLSSPLEFRKKDPAPVIQEEVVVKKINTSEVEKAIFSARCQLTKLHPQMKNITPTQKDLEDLAVFYSGKQYLAYTEKFEEIFKIKR